MESFESVLEHQHDTGTSMYAARQPLVRNYTAGYKDSGRERDFTIAVDLRIDNFGFMNNREIERVLIELEKHLAMAFGEKAMIHWAGIL